MCGSPDDKFDASCVCQKAVLTCYTGMKRSGVPEDSAVDAACRVYTYHHPEVDAVRSRLTVENWVYAGTRH